MPALTLPTFPNPHDRNNPLANAYADIGELAVNLRNDTCRVILYVHPNADARQDEPAGTLGMQGGDNWPNGHAFPRLSEMMADPDFAAAFAVIAQKIFNNIKNNPACAGATDFVPPA